MAPGEFLRGGLLGCILARVGLLDCGTCLTEPLPLAGEARTSVLQKPCATNGSAELGACKEIFFIAFGATYTSKLSCNDC